MNYTMDEYENKLQPDLSIFSTVHKKLSLHHAPFHFYIFPIQHYFA